jgi:hypothetical protein
MKAGAFNKSLSLESGIQGWHQISANMSDPWLSFADYVVIPLIAPRLED